MSDAELAGALGVYAGMVSRVLDRPERWLGVDLDPAAHAGRGRRLLGAVRGRFVGRVNPTSTSWAQVPVAKRVRWWTRRIALSAGVAAAAPRVGGLLADRLPLQDALGASASGLAVCATAREYGITEAVDWVPLIATVIFDRDLTGQNVAVPPAAASETALVEAPNKAASVSGPVPGVRSGPVRRAGRTLWHLAQVFLELGDLFDQRPRGGAIPRLIGKFPAVGVAGGWLDERGAIRTAARRTSRLLQKH